MRVLQKSIHSVILAFVFFSLSQIVLSQESTRINPQPRVIILNHDVKNHQELLTGPPGTMTMHSGLVILEPDSSVGTHNTKKYEEVLVVLEGEGEMKITGGPTLKFKEDNVAYCPPHSEHNVFNTGRTKLKYIYIVAITETENKIINKKSNHKD